MTQHWMIQHCCLVVAVGLQLLFGPASTLYTLCPLMFIMQSCPVYSVNAKDGIFTSNYMHKDRWSVLQCVQVVVVLELFQCLDHSMFAVSGMDLH